MASFVGNLGEFLDRVDERLKILNSQRAKGAKSISARKVSMAAGFSAELISSMRKQWKQGKQTGVSQRVLIALAKQLKTTPEWLVTGRGSGSGDLLDERRPVSYGGVPILELRGAVAPGVFFSDGGVMPDVGQRAPISADCRYPVEHQYAMIVRGNAVDRVARDGEYLIVIPVSSKHEPHNGDLVIVSRTISEAKLREVTARRYVEKNGAIELRFESLDSQFLDPKHKNYQGPLTYVQRKRDIEIIGIVIGIYRPL